MKTDAKISRKEGMKTCILNIAFQKSEAMLYYRESISRETGTWRDILRCGKLRPRCPSRRASLFGKPRRLFMLHEEGGFPMMRIGQFCETYPPSVDGVGRVMEAYCQTLDEMGHQSVYIAPKNPAYTSETPTYELLLYPGISIPGQAYRLGIPRLSRRFRRSAEAMHFDVIHAHSPFVSGLEARRVAKKIGAPVVATFHSKYYDDFYEATRSKLLAKLGISIALRFYRSCDEVWTVNEKTAEVLRGYGYKGEIITMLNGTNPLSVTDAERTDALSRFPLRPSVPTLIFAGQMDYKKNVDSILRACALLSQKGVDFQLIMAGSGSNESSIRALAKGLGLAKQTIFTGFLPERHVLLSLMERADLLVFPSVYDNAPMVVREAAAMGTPALLVENSCAAEGIAHQDNGFLCPNTPESIAECIEEALPLCTQVGERARATIPVPWEEIMAKAVARYERLIEKKRSAKEQGVCHEN